MMSSSLTLIWKLKHYILMEFLGVAQKKKVTFSFLPWYVHVAFFMTLCLTSQLGHVLFNSIFSIFLNYVVFCATCAQVYDFPFKHGFQALPLKFVKVQTNTSLFLRRQKVVWICVEANSSISHSKYSWFHPILCISYKWLWSWWWWHVWHPTLWLSRFIL
jgi:hypothetical protein